jgi:flagellar assembly factor FliW
MTIQSKAYGSVEIDERQRILFPFGILGFENLKVYALLDAAQQPFYWLQSLDVREIAFVLISPAIFRPDYEVKVFDDELSEIGLESVEDENALIFAIVTIPENQSKMTANLQGPIIINKETKQGRQLINSDPRWKTKHLILEELSAERTRAC